MWTSVENISGASAKIWTVRVGPIAAFSLAANLISRGLSDLGDRSEGKAVLGKFFDRLMEEPNATRRVEP